jgi:hypothetical protein
MDCKKFVNFFKPLKVVKRGAWIYFYFYFLINLVLLLKKRKGKRWARGRAFMNHPPTFSIITKAERAKLSEAGKGGRWGRFP